MYTLNMQIEFIYLGSDQYTQKTPSLMVFQNDNREKSYQLKTILYNYS